MSENLTIELIAEQALRAHGKKTRVYDSVRDVAALEAMRSSATDDEVRRVLDSVILARKRESKAIFEVLGLRADQYDKAALPASAAVPAFLTFLDSSHILASPQRVPILILSYLFAAIVWFGCRRLSFRYASDSRIGLAKLGKVD